MRLSGNRLRHAVRRLHLWLGLTLGGLFVLLGFTGSVLAFYPELDAMLHPEIRVEGRGPPDWDRALATVRAAYPDHDGPWRFEIKGKSGAIPARYYNPPERADHAFRPMMVWLSPDGSRILRRDYWGEYAMTFIYDLHYRLLLGEVAGKILGWLGFGLLALLLSGLWAWWPRGSWLKALRFKRHAPLQRNLRDWHKLTGLWGLVLLFILTITGIMLELPKESDTALGAIGLPIDHAPHVLHQQTTARNGHAILPSQAIHAAMTALPEARPAWIEIPQNHGGAFKLRIQVPGDPSHRFPHSFVWVDADNGNVIAVQDARKSRAGTTVNNWIHPLHDGSAGGLFGRLLVAGCGLLPLVLFVSGLMRWYIMRAKRNAAPSAPT